MGAAFIFLRLFLRQLLCLLLLPPILKAVFGKESACNAGDSGLIPGSGRSPGEGIGYSLQYSWASLVVQLVKNPPAMRETRFNPWLGKILWKIVV